MSIHQKRNSWLNMPGVQVGQTTGNAYLDELKAARFAADVVTAATLSLYRDAIRTSSGYDQAIQSAGNAVSRWKTVLGLWRAITAMDPALPGVTEALQFGAPVAAGAEEAIARQIQSVAELRAHKAANPPRSPLAPGSVATSSPATASDSKAPWLIAAGIGAAYLLWRAA